MGLPTSYKRIRKSHSPESFQPPDMDHYSDPADPLDRQDTREWSPLAHSSAKPPAFPFPQPRAFSGTLDSLEAPAPPSADPGVKSPLEALPDSLLLKILQMSQPTAWDLCRLSCVGRAWRRVCLHRSFWTRLRVGSGSLRPGVEQLAPRCSQLAELFVDDPRCELHILHPIIIACAQSLRRVVIDCDRDASTRNEASVSSVLWLISLYCKNVESIELQSSSRDATIGNLEGRTMWYLTSAFRNVRYFACLPRASLTKQCIYLMAIAWRDLECVRINMEGLATDDLLALRKCTSLRALELVGGSLSPLVDPALGMGMPGAIASTGAPHASMPREAVDRRTEAQESQTLGYPMSCPGHDSGCTDAGDDLRMPVQGTGCAVEYQGCASSGGYGPVVFHPSLELLVLNRVECNAATAASLALACPNLKRILVSGALCEACATSDGPCRLGVADCVRRRVDEIQMTLSQVRVSLHP